MSTALKNASFKTGIRDLLRSINRYKIFIFFIVVAVLYGFIIWRINVYVAADPTELEKNAAAEHAKVPKINESTVLKMKSLKDNSVNVQTLFDSARNNPFSE